jgi:hypothetical protein
MFRWLCIWKANAVDPVGAVGDPQDISGLCTTSIMPLPKETKSNPCVVRIDLDYSIEL